jgi:tetratricopeptide (TPR) repeat protein
MRARAALAGLLADAGRTDEAVAHYEALLELNPNDNQGLRYELLDLYLETGRLAPAAALFKQFDGEGSAMFTWGRVLERFLNGAADAARAALAEARKANAYVEPFLTGRKRLPREMPDYYSPGKESEAVVCMDLIGRAWQQHPEAIAWLKSLRLTSGPATCRCLSTTSSKSTSPVPSRMAGLPSIISPKRK